MAIERRRVINLSGTTKLLAFHADKKDEGSSNLDPAFNFEGVSELFRSTSSARTCARRNTLADRAHTRMRYALSAGHLVLGKRFRVATVARCLGTGTTPAGHARFQLVQANAAHANRQSGVVVRVPMPMEFGELLKGRLPLEGLRVSVATPLNLMSSWTGSRCLQKMWAFRADILELGQPILLAMYVGRIWDCIGPIIALMTAAVTGRLRGITSFPRRIVGTTRCRSAQTARCCMRHQIFAGVASAFNTLADEHSSATQSRRLLDSHSEKLRSTVETAMAGCWNRAPDSSYWGDVWPLGNRLRKPPEYLRLLWTPLWVFSGLGSPDTAVASVWRSS